MERSWSAIGSRGWTSCPSSPTTPCTRPRRCPRTTSTRAGTRASTRLRNGSTRTTGAPRSPPDMSLDYRSDATDQGLDHYLEEARGSEVPPADLCLKIARCYERLDAPQDAFAWLARVPDAGDAFRSWSA